MDYTLSDSFSTDAGTGHRLHDDDKAIPTVVSADDMNMVIWSLMEVMNAAGVAPAGFDPAVPATYTKVLAAIRVLTPGRFANVQVFSTSGTYTPSSARVSKIIVEAVGGGGAGGGAVATTSSGSVGGGGGAGCYAKVLFTAVPASAVVTIGAGGAGVSGGNGGVGGTTSFGAYASVSGGGGGGASAAGTVYPVGGPPAVGGSTVSTSGSAISTSPGGSGQWGIVFTSNALSGMGGSSILGQGAFAAGSGLGSNAGIGKGSGGSGACNSGTLSAQAGGAGASGVVIVYEYE